MTLEIKIADLTDFAPTESTSLVPASKDWDPNKWAKELQEAKRDKYNLEINLDIAKKTYNEFFAELPVKTKKNTEE